MDNYTAQANASSPKNLDFFSPIVILPANPFPPPSTTGRKADVLNDVSLEHLQVYSGVQDSFRSMFDILIKLVGEV